MESIGVVFARSINNDDLKSFISEWGGIWDGNPSLNHGVIQRGPMTIYCNQAKPASFEYSPAELVEIATYIGVVPQTCVAVDISRSPGSQDLALEFANQLVKRWGGLIDGNGVIEIQGGWIR